MSTQDNQNPSKAKHPGIPKEWKRVGSGGNAIVWSDGTRAIKRLNRNAGTEAKARFIREAQIQQSIRDVPGLRVVNLQVVREREGETEIVMDLMDGNLEEVIDRFSGSPEKAARAIIPIAETLLVLSQRENQIHHRDIKPSNLLFRADENNLYLADFGCAYLAEDERLTPERRAMGAWAYRPPEYSVGRVNEIDEKGDVFCLGKVFWAMVNGKRGVVFPGPVWFGREYDLGLLYPENPKIHHTMLAISRAAAINPNSRPSLSQLIDGLRVIADPSNVSGDELAAIELQLAEEMIEVEFQQRRASTATFVRALHADLHGAIARLHERNLKILVWKQWFDEARRSPQTADSLVQQVAEQESDAPIVIVRFRRFILNTRFHPATDTDPAFFKAIFASEIDRSKTSTLIVYNSPAGSHFTSEIADESARSGAYSPKVLEDFLRMASQKFLIENGR